MKKNTYIIILLGLIVFTNCKKNTLVMNDMSDIEFINFISDNNDNKKGIIKIDSIIKTNNSFSAHKTGLLYYKKGAFLFNLRKFVASSINQQKALLLFEQENNKKFIAKANLRLARTNIELKKHKKAIKQINLALKFFKETKSSKNEMSALNTLSHLHFKNKNYKESIKVLKQIAIIILELKDTIFLSTNYNNIASLSTMINDNENAVEYYKKAIFLNAKINSLNTHPLRNLGEYYFTIGKTKKSILLFIEALKIESKKSDLFIKKEIYDFLLDTIKDSKFSYLSKYESKRDSINKLILKAENEEKIKSVKNEYELIAKEKELILKQERSTKNKIIFTVVSGLILFLMLFLFQRSRNSKLKLMQDKLVLEQKVLRSQMNPHFIFNALTSIQKNLLDEDLLKSSTSLSRFAKLIRQNFEFTSKSLIGLDEDLNALKNYIETQKLRFEDKFNYQINIQKGLDISYIKIPPMLLQPFIENAIEHGLRSKKGKGHLTINVFENNELIHFEIIDDGVGFKNKENTDNREHAIDIFFKRLKLRNLNEDKSFLIEPSLKNGKGTKISFTLKL